MLLKAMKAAILIEGNLVAQEASLALDNTALLTCTSGRNAVATNAVNTSLSRTKAATDEDKGRLLDQDSNLGPSG
jgi:hypothetical protein